MSGKLTLTSQTQETLSETKSVMRFTKQIAIVPLIVTSPAGIAEFLLQINPHTIPLRLARCFMCLYILCSLSNAFMTISLSSLAKQYRGLLREACGCKPGPDYEIVGRYAHF
jgi:hypothetical protein